MPRETMAEVLDNLGARLAELRRERGWTQAEVAEKAGMLEKDYQAIENARRAITIRTALTLAHTFDVPLRAVFELPKVPLARRRPRIAAEVNRSLGEAPLSVAEKGPLRRVANSPEGPAPTATAAEPEDGSTVAVGTGSEAVSPRGKDDNSA